MRRFKTKEELQDMENIQIVARPKYDFIYYKRSLIGMLKHSEYGKQLTELDEQSFCNPQFMELVTTINEDGER